MVFCNRCGKEEDRLYSNNILEMSLCKACADSFDIWLGQKIHLRGNDEEQVHDLKLELAQSSKRNENLALENTQLKGTLRQLENKLNSLGGSKDISNIESAKNTMKLAGYVFYKYAKPTALQKRRHRRTKKEIEAARANELK